MMQRALGCSNSATLRANQRCGHVESDETDANHNFTSLQARLLYRPIVGERAASRLWHRTLGLPGLPLACLLSVVGAKCECVRKPTGLPIDVCLIRSDLTALNVTVSHYRAITLQD